jgi:hypothetical protein
MKLSFLWFGASLLLLGACNAPIVREYTLEVAPQTKKCVFGWLTVQDPNPNVPNQQVSDCIQAREDSSQPFYHHREIQGFTFVSGFKYRLRIRSVLQTPVMADDIGTLQLIAVLEKTPASN